MGNKSPLVLSFPALLLGVFVPCRDVGGETKAREEERSKRRETSGKVII